MLSSHQAVVGRICVFCLTCHRTPADLRLYTRKVEVTRDRIPNWPHDKLTVLAEQSSVFYDLMTPEVLEQVRLHSILWDLRGLLELRGCFACQLEHNMGATCWSHCSDDLVTVDQLQSCGMASLKYLQYVCKH